MKIKMDASDLNSPVRDKSEGNEMETLEIGIGEGGLFKRKVSQIMENKEIWEELKKQSRQEFTEVAKQLMQKSSIYAVSQVGHAESPYRKVLWILVLVAGLTGCCYEVRRFLTLYLQYPVVVNLNVEKQSSLKFPAITVCSINRVSKGFQKCMESNIPDDSFSMKDAPIQGRHQLIMSDRRRVASCLALIKNQTGNETLDSKNKYDMNTSQRENFEKEMKNLMLKCSFNGRHCSLDIFSEFQSLRHGNCFTFNRHENAADVMKTSMTGINSGLELVLNLDSANDQPVALIIGFRVVIHDPVIDPNLDEEGFNINAGFETTLVMKQTCMQRLPAPFRDKCFDYRSHSFKNQIECMTMCIQRHTYNNCSCTDPTLKPLKDYPKCNITDPSDSYCLDAVLASLGRDELACDCKLPCFSTKYDYKISTSLWPAEFCLTRNCDQLEAFKRIRKSHAKLVVYYSSLDQTIFEQKAMFQNSELFSQLGGQMGLWLGLSLVAAFEIIENLVYIGKYIGTILFGEKIENVK